MTYILRNIGDLSNCRLKNLVFDLNTTHHLWKVIKIDRSITFVALSKNLFHFIRSSLIFLDNHLKSLDVEGQLLLIVVYSISYKLFHFFHKIFAWKSFVASQMVRAKEIDHHSLHLLLV